MTQQGEATLGKGRYGEPWHVYESASRWVWTGEYRDGGGLLAPSPSRADRIVACVNALDGLDPAKLAAFLIEAKEANETGEVRPSFRVAFDALTSTSQEEKA